MQNKGLRLSRQKNTAGREGSALIMGLLSVLVLGTISSAYISGIVTEQRNTLRTETTLSALSLAEAGAEYGVWEVMYGGADFSAGDHWETSGSDKILNAEFKTPGNVKLGEYDITCATVGDGMIVTAVGYVPTKAEQFSHATVQVKLLGRQVFNQAVFGVDSIDANSHILFDSYDYRDGPYNSATASANGDIGVNSTAAGAIQLGSNVEIKGDVYAGAGGSVATVIDTAGATITGSEKTFTAPFILPSISVPEDQPAVSGSLDVKNKKSATITSDCSYADLSVVGTLNINGDVGATAENPTEICIYVANACSIKGSVNIAANAKVTLIVGADFSVQNADIFNNSNDPTHFNVYGLDSCTTMDVKANSNFYGTIYGPEANFVLTSNSGFFGAVIAKTTKFRGNAQLHYDESLMDRSATLGYQVASWQTK